MTKQIIISGSIALRKALVEELKLSLISSTSITNFDHLTVVSPESRSLQGHGSLTVTGNYEVYTLPGQWDKAIQALNDYFTPPYKIGDWVVVSGGETDENFGCGFIGPVTSKLYPIGNNNATGLLDNNSTFSVKKGNNYYNIKEVDRLATKEEIKKTESISIGKYKVEIFPSKTSVKIGCTTYSLEDINAVHRVLKLPNYPGVTFGGIEITLETICDIITQLEK